MPPKEPALKKVDIATKIIDLTTNKTPEFNAASETIKLMKLGKDVLKSRLRALTPTTESPVSSRFKWDGRMIYLLLELRLDKFGVVFSGSKSNSQRNSYWSKILLLFNRQFAQQANFVDRTAVQLQTKYSALKVNLLITHLIVFQKEYSDIISAEEETGNEKEVEHPSYWDSLVSFLGDKNGLGIYCWAC